MRSITLDGVATLEQIIRNQREIQVAASHFVPEDAPGEIAGAVAALLSETGK